LASTKTKGLKILLYDLETTPRKVYVWAEYEQNVLKVVEESYILCFAYKWLGDKMTKVIALPDFKGYKKNKRNDYHLVKKLHGLMEEADIVMGQNSDKFDNRWSNKQFIKHKLKPVSHFNSIDTLKIARKYFNFPSNRLDSLGEFLGIGRKVAHEGKNLWFKCMDGEKKAWKDMIRYARQDVVLLEEIYLRFRPWVENHPNVAIHEHEIACTKCGSYNMQKRGKQRTRISVFQRYQCQDCGGWSTDRKSEEHKPILK